MSNKDQNQTLVPKDDEEQWLKTLHGELSPNDNETRIDAAKIRNYLVARDVAIATNEPDDIDDLNAVSVEEAGAIYRQAKATTHRRSKSRGMDILKTYGVGAVIGGLAASVLFLLYMREPVAPAVSLSATGTQNDLNLSDYPALKFGEESGPLPNMLLIPGGVTNIGCAKGWDDVAGGCRPTEFPSHAVTIKPFLISQHEVTYGQFRKFMGATDYVTDAEKDNRGCVHEDTSKPGNPFVMNSTLNWEAPGYEQNDSFPVTCVSWHDAQNYIAWLREETKQDYRLPTEAEWEHAARGGKATAYFWGSAATNNQANYSGTAGKDQWPFAAPVGQFPANKYAVQDTAGNLWEWVQDCWHETYSGAPTDGSAWEECADKNIRVRRGGAWDMNGAGMRSAIRSKGYLNDRSNLYGFRVARDWEKPEK